MAAEKTVVLRHVADKHPNQQIDASGEREPFVVTDFFAQALIERFIGVVVTLWSFSHVWFSTSLVMRLQHDAGRGRIKSGKQ